MIKKISPNTQAILLLNAPLIAGHGITSPDLLSPSEYKRLARHLMDLQREPGDLLSPAATELFHACNVVIDEDRLQRLLGRGFLLSQAIERWTARAIWVVSRADAEYPKRLKTRLRENAPAVLYGCGDIDLLESGGLAVVGSRDVNDDLIDYTMAVGTLCAHAGKSLVSGGAKGIDQAAMRSALEAEGKAIGVLGDSLERRALNREHRDLLIDGRLVLVSPYDPSAGFNVGNAMQRNKLIYALADAALVVNSDFNSGGTWAGATEQLDKLRLVPIYVRVAGKAHRGLDALRQKGAIPWPQPQDQSSFLAVFDADVVRSSQDSVQEELSLLNRVSVTNVPDISTSPPSLESTSSNASSVTKQELSPPVNAPIGEGPGAAHAKPVSDASRAPAAELFSAVRITMCQLLKNPMKETEIAAAIEVSKPQVRHWLQHLVEEGLIEKRKQSVYAVKSKGLFD